MKNGKDEKKELEKELDKAIKMLSKQQSDGNTYSFEDAILVLLKTNKYIMSKIPKDEKQNEEK